VKKLLLVLIFAFAILVGLTGCPRGTSPDTYNPAENPSTEPGEYLPEATPYIYVQSGNVETVPDIYIQARNLQKLARVWGFTMFTHRAFLLGEKCWDEELLNLIPLVRFANEDDVNDILYQCFIGPGDDGYDLDWEIYRTALVAIYEENLQNLLHLINYTPHGLDDEVLQAHVQAVTEATNNVVTFILEYEYVSCWAAMQIFIEEYALVSTVNYLNLRPMADKSWINEVYLGESLYTVLSRFHRIQIFDFSQGPVYFNHAGNSTFTNKYHHPNMNFSDERCRLLGLFRLWNVMEYYFPYLDIIDDCWHGLLLESIPKMLEGSNRLRSRLRDAHVRFWYRFRFLNEKFGRFAVPVVLVEAERKLVVSEIVYPHTSILSRGDIILTLNGVDINELVADMLQYLSSPSDERALAYIVREFDVIRSYSPVMEVGVLRNGEEVTLSVVGQYGSIGHSFAFMRTRPTISYKLLDNNIGLVNPELQTSAPSRSVPSVFADIFRGHSGGITTPNAFFYDRNVVILMDENSESRPEFAIMSLRNGENVTVMGTNSIGANGDFVTLNLPGDIGLLFTGLGVYTPHGGQTQRIGLSPDIYVHRTVSGVAEGRDELMEAAIQFLLEAAEN